MALAARLLLVARLARNETEARAKLLQALDSGCAADRFARMVSGLGGPPDLLAALDRHLASAPVMLPVKAAADGYVHAVDCRRLGLTIISLGGGRHRPEDDIDRAVGMTGLAELGQQVEAGQPIAIVHARSEDAARHAVVSVLAAYHVADEQPALPPSVYRALPPGDWQS